MIVNNKKGIPLQKKITANNLNYNDKNFINYKNNQISGDYIVYSSSEKHSSFAINKNEKKILYNNNINNIKDSNKFKNDIEKEDKYKNNQILNYINLDINDQTGRLDKDNEYNTVCVFKKTIPSIFNNIKTLNFAKNSNEREQSKKLNIFYV